MRKLFAGHQVFGKSRYTRVPAQPEDSPAVLVYEAIITGKIIKPSNALDLGGIMITSEKLF